MGHDMSFQKVRTVTREERPKALLGWAAKASAWEEPNTHFPFVAWCPDNTD